MSYNRAYNFSAGPSMLPLSVIESVAENLPNYKGCGESVMEMSHRSKEFKTILEEAEKDLAEPIEVGISEGNLEGKALNAECPFVYGDSEWKLQTFVPEDMLIDGELAMDDRVNFLIQAVCGEESYVLFDEMVHIGVPAADVFIDQQEQLHIILRDVRTAKYRVTDFVYDAENKKFIGKDALNEDAINYIGTTGR